MTVRRSFVWALLGQVIAFIVQFLGLIVVSRLLTPHEIGIYVISIATLGLSQVFATLGISSFIVREANLSREILASAFTVNAIILVCLSFFLIAISFASGPLLGTHEAGRVLRILAVSNLFPIITLCPMAMFQREMRFKPLSIISTTNVVVQAVATIGFALAGASYMSAAYASLISGMVMVATNIAMGRRYIVFSLSLAAWQPIVKFGLQVMSVSGVAIITGRLSELIVGRMLGVAALGLYGRASQLSSIIFENVYGTATRVVFPQLSKDYRDGGDWRGTYLRSMAMITAVMWPFLAGLALLARPAVDLLYGERWLPAAAPLAALLVGQIVGIAFGMNWELFVLRGEIGRQARYEVVRLGFGLPLIAFGCLFGLLGAGLAGTATALVGLIVYYPQVNRLAELDRRQMPAIYRDSAFLTLVAVWPAALLMAIWRGSAHTPLALVAGAVSLGILSWLIAIMATAHPLRDELRRVARWLWRDGRSPR